MATDPRVDEMVAVGQRLGRVSALYRKLPPPDTPDLLAIAAITKALRQRYWELAHAIAADLPR